MLVKSEDLSKLELEIIEVFNHFQSEYKKVNPRARGCKIDKTTYNQISIALDSHDLETCKMVNSWACKTWPQDNFWKNHLFISTLYKSHSGRTFNDHVAKMLESGHTNTRSRSYGDEEAFD